jgi:hypothetical protein
MLRRIDFWVGLLLLLLLLLLWLTVHPLCNCDSSSCPPGHNMRRTNENDRDTCETVSDDALSRNERLGMRVAAKLTGRDGKKQDDGGAQIRNKEVAVVT